MNTAGDRPAMTQYFALQSVLVSLLAGLSPILWGWLLDTLHATSVTVGRLTLDGYALFFGFQWLMLSVVFLALMQVKEGNAARTSALLYRVFVVAPGQAMAGITHRGHFHL